jgi:hypothetical protein
MAWGSSPHAWLSPNSNLSRGAHWESVPLVTPHSENISRPSPDSLASKLLVSRSTASDRSTEAKLRIMPPVNLVALAASLREALDSPLVVESDADREARLDIIDMIPVLNRKFVGEVQTIRDMAWEVHTCRIFSCPL